MKIIVPLDEAERVLTLQLALKCADLGHTSADLPVHLQWVSGLEEEVRPCTACLTPPLLVVHISRCFSVTYLTHFRARGSVISAG